MQLGTSMDQVICTGCHRPLEAGQRIVWYDDALHHEACAAASLVTINLAIMEYTYYRGAPYSQDDERYQRHRPDDHA